MLARLGLGALAAFLLFWAAGWWIQQRDGVEVQIENEFDQEPVRVKRLSPRAALLARHGLSAWVGALGVLVGCIAVLGPREADWAQRGAGAMVVFSLVPVCGWGSMVAWRAFRAPNLPAREDTDFIEDVISKGPSEAIAGALLELLPARVLLLLGSFISAAMAAGLLAYAVVLLADVEVPAFVVAAGEWGEAALDLFDAAALLLVASALVIGMILGVLFGQLDTAVACLALLALQAVGVGVLWLMGYADGLFDGVETLLSPIFG